MTAEIMKLPVWIICLAILLGTAGCGGGGDGGGAGGIDGDSNQPTSSSSVDDIEEQMHETLDALVTDTDFTLVVEAENGHQFIHRTGASTEFTSYESASTSKWVTAAVIMDLVKRGVLDLDDHPQDDIDFWPTTGHHSQIQLRHLLSFTSGLREEPLCINSGAYDFSDCVEQILNSNPTIATPGQEFYYGSAHMQVAGLMAVKASGASSWAEVFADFQRNTNLFLNSAYDLPSTGNPRLAGGMHWTAVEYMEFLEAIYREEILSPSLISTMSSDQIAGATIVSSPADAAGFDWHYGLGNWIECDGEPFDCVDVQRVSSPGAYGAYPFIDYAHGYFGIIARQGSLGTFVMGYSVYLSVADLLEQWAAQNQM